MITSPGRWSIALCLLLTLSFTLLAPAPASRAQASGPSSGALFTNPAAPSVEQQFADLERHGDSLAAHRGAGHDPDVCRHYQSINRYTAPDGTPYMLLTRSGTDTGPWCDPLGGWEHYPGELLIVRMDSRGRDGERMRSNLLQPDQDLEDTVPPAEDIGISQVYFNGRWQGPDNEKWPAYSHPGGAQLLGNLLFIPLEDHCLTRYGDDGQGECDGDALEGRGGLLIVDISNPENPNIVHFAETLFGSSSQKFGVVGVAPIQPGEVDAVPELAEKGGYLYALTWGNSTNVRFAYSVNRVDKQGKPVFSIKLLAGVWDEEFLGNKEDKWLNWQMLNFVRDTDGTLYLIGGEKDGSTDMVGLFRMNVQAVFSTSTLKQAISYVAEKHLLLNNPNMGSLDAGSSVYVSPTGQIIIYTGPHDNDAPGGSIEIGEFRSKHVTASGECGLQLSTAQFQAHASILEGASLAFSGATGTYVEPWVTLYPGKNMGYDDDRHLTMSYGDQYHGDGSPKENWAEFVKLDFNDAADSFRWCGPHGAQLMLFEHSWFNERNAGKTIVRDGAGSVESSSNLESDFGKGWHDAVSSMRIDWQPPTALSYSLIGAPEGASIDATSGKFSWRTTEAQGPGSYTFGVRVCDNSSAPACKEEQVTLSVGEVNEAPSLEPIAGQKLPWGRPISFTAAASDADIPANTLSFQLVGAPDGASIDAATGAFTWTPAREQVGEHAITVQVCDNGSPSLCAEQQFAVEVQKYAATLALTEAGSGQYSDQVTLAATLAEDGGAPLAGMTIDFTIGTQSASATTDEGGVARATLALDQPAGDHQATATFAGDAGYIGASDARPFAIAAEDAAVSFDPGNPATVPVAQAGGVSGPFTLLAHVGEASPDQPAGRAQPGDITRASLGMQLVPVGPGSTIAGTCAPGAPGAALAFTCSFDAVPVNTYTAVATVNGGYYHGGAESVVTVYDPDLGLATGAGWLQWPNKGTAARATFAFAAKYNRQGSAVLGNLLLTRHGASGGGYRLKGTSIESLAQGQDATVPLGWAVFRGTASYQEPGWRKPKENYTYTIYVEDRNLPGTGVDRFWIEVKDPQGQVVEALSFAGGARDNAVAIGGGAIAVLQRGQ